MFHFLSLLGGLALFSSATAQTTWMVGVGTPVGDNVFNPSYLVSHVSATQPNRHTDNSASRMQQEGILFGSISLAITIP
jgi:hypothetical protein